MYAAIISKMEYWLLLRVYNNIIEQPFYGRMEQTMSKNIRKERKYDLYKAILDLKDLDECVKFFDDLCAVTEVRVMEQRYEVAAMLLDHKVYSEIMEASNASSATISRVNRMLNYGTGVLPELIRRTKGIEDSPATEEEASEE